MEESSLRWPTDKEHEEMEEVCSIGEVPHSACCAESVSTHQSPKKLVLRALTPEAEDTLPPFQLVLHRRCQCRC